MKHEAGTELLITGAGGFTGMHACAYFAAQGMQVTAAVRPGGSPAPAGCRSQACDLADAEAAQALIRRTKPAAVLHLAGASSVRGSWEQPAACLESSVMGTVHLLEAVRLHGEPGTRVLVVGSRLGRLGEQSQAPHPYGLAKSLQLAAALAWHRLYGLPVLAAEPSNLTGPGRSGGVCSLIAQHIAAQERGAPPRPFRLSSRTERRDFLDVRDAVSAYGAILREGVPGTVYAVASGRTRSLQETAEMFRALSLAASAWEWECASEATLQGAEAALPAADAADGEEPLRQLGWEPRIAFRQSLADTLEYYRHSQSQPEGKG